MEWIRWYHNIRFNNRTLHHRTCY